MERQTHMNIHKMAGLGMAALFLAAGLVSACNQPAANSNSAAKPAASRPETPADFKDKKNALDGNAEAIAKGKSTFASTCTSCHGAEADGNCDAGKMLNPPAGNLRSADFQKMSDGYIFWRISKGGTGANISGSTMQAFDATLTEDQRWQLVAYLRSLPAK